MQFRNARRESTRQPSRSKITALRIARDPLRSLPAALAVAHPRGSGSRDDIAAGPAQERGMNEAKGKAAFELTDTPPDSRRRRAAGAGAVRTSRGGRPTD